MVKWHGLAASGPGLGLLSWPDLDPGPSLLASLSLADSELRAVGAAGRFAAPLAARRLGHDSSSNPSQGPLAARAKPPDSAGVRETPGGAGPGPPEGCRYEFKFDSELTTCQSKQISVADAARSRLSRKAQSLWVAQARELSRSGSSVALGRSGSQSSVALRLL